MTPSVFESSRRIVVFSLLLVLCGAVLSTGSVAADDGVFEVEIVETDDSVDENGNLPVVFEVRNDGKKQATQELVLENSSGVIHARRNVTLGPGESRTVTMGWQNVPERPTRTITPIVRSEDDTDSASVRVEWAEFEVRELAVDSEAVSSNTDVRFEATVRNIGTVSDTQTVTFTTPSGEVTTRSLSLDATDSETIPMSRLSAPSDPGNYTYEVSTSHDSQQQQLRVLEGASFGVNITDTSVEDTSFSVVATIDNRGDFEDTQPIEFSVDGTETETQQITVPAGAQRSITFTHDTGSRSFTADVSVETQQPDIATTRISQAAIRNGPRIGTITPQYVQGGEAITIGYTADGPDIDNVTLVVTDPNGETFVSREVAQGVERYQTVQMPERSRFVEGNYDVTIEVEDDFGRIDAATEENAFEADTVLSAENVDFSESTYQSPAGDFVEVDISTGDLDEAYVMIGGDRESGETNLQNYLDVLHVSGDATFVINTRLIGADRPSEDVFIPVNGEVTSYAHSIGADSQPAGVFDEMSFENENGNEIASSLAEFRTMVGLAQRGSPIQAGRYRLVAGGSGTVIERDDNIPDFRQPVARSNIVLTQPEVRNVTTYTLPPASADRVDQFDEPGDPIGTDDIGSLLSEATETDRIARGDRILIEVQSVGMFGALMDRSAPTNSVITDNGDGTGAIASRRMATLLNNPEGVRVALSDSQLASANHPGATLQFGNVDSSDLRILPDDSADQWDSTEAIGTEPLIGGFYIVIDTRGSEAFDGRPRDGDEMTFDIAYQSASGERFQYKDYDFTGGELAAPFDPDFSTYDGGEYFPYFGSSTTTMSASDSFIFEAPYIDYGETTLNGNLIIGAEPNGVISGETNIAPGSEVQIQLIASDRPDPQLITIEDIEINDDRTFQVTEDFSAFEPGERVEVEFYSQGRLIENRLLDKRGVHVVDSLDNPSLFEITNFSGDVEVPRGQQLGDIEATITNTGEIEDRQQVTFNVSGETVREQSVVLDSGEEVTLDLSEEFVVLSPGEYSYTVQTQDDERTGQLTVTEAEDTEINTVDADNATVGESPEENDEDDGSESEDDSGLLGLIGLRSRDVTIAAAVTGAMHILGQWT